MIHGLHSIGPGSVLFLAGKTPVSWIIRVISGFRFSHVAYCAAPGMLIESNIFGVTTVPVAYYANSWLYNGEVVTPKGLTLGQANEMTRIMLSYVHSKYDYFLLLGNALKHMHLVPKKWVTRFNIRNAYICSELVAIGLHSIGRYNGLPELATPKSVYEVLTKEEVK